jgi:general secretion pathway protein D
VAEIQKVFTYQAQNAVIARAEADKIALAEKIVADLDKPRSEVVVDILVMIVSKNKTMNLAAAVAPTGINSPITFTPRPGIGTITPGTSTGGAGGGTPTTTPASSSIPLSNLGRISTADFSMTIPGGLSSHVTDSNTSKCALASDAGRRRKSEPQN